MDLKGHNYYQGKKGFYLLNSFSSIIGQYALLCIYIKITLSESLLCLMLESPTLQCEGHMKDT